MQKAVTGSRTPSEAEQRAADSSPQYVLFMANGGLFAAALDDVLEVIEPEWWVRIPHAAPWVEGLLYHHGDPLVVANARALLDGDGPRRDETVSVLRLKAPDMKFGILVDRVVGTWRSTSPATPSRDAAFVKAIWELNGKLLSLIDLEVLLDRASRIFATQRIKGRNHGPQSADC